MAAAWDNVEADFAGLSNDADEPISIEQIEWATHVFVMEKRQKARLSQVFGTALKGKRVTCLNIPDTYDYLQPELVERLTRELKSYLRLG